MISAMTMIAATAARLHVVASVRVCSWGSDSPVPGLAGPLLAGLDVVCPPPDEGAGFVGVAVDGPEGLLGEAVGVGVVAATWPCRAAGFAAFAAAATDNRDPVKRVSARVVRANLRSIVSPVG